MNRYAYLRSTFAEMAEEFGIAPGVLRACLGRLPDAPKPVLKFPSSETRRGATWYDPREMRAWAATQPWKK